MYVAVCAGSYKLRFYRIFSKEHEEVKVIRYAESSY